MTLCRLQATIAAGGRTFWQRPPRPKLPKRSTPGRNCRTGPSPAAAILRLDFFAERKNTRAAKIYRFSNRREAEEPVAVLGDRGNTTKTFVERYK